MSDNLDIKDGNYVDAQMATKVIGGVHHPKHIAFVAPAEAGPLTGTSAVTATLGPFTPDLGRAIWLTLSGTWAGTVQLLRSRDGGTTKLPLTYGDGTAKPTFSGNMQAPVAEETVSGATYYLEFTRTSGTLGYRLEN